MKTKLLGIAAVIGLSLGLANAPANAHGPQRGVSFSLGPAYVYYGNRYRRVDPGYRYRPVSRYRYNQGGQRFYRDRDLWHHCFDGNWYPYHDRKHQRYHERLRHQYRKRQKPRYRYW